MDRGTVMKYRLEELVDLQIGRTPPRKEFEWFNTNGEGYKWVSIKDMGNSGRFISDTSEYLTEAAQKRFGIPIVEKGTLLLSFKLTVGRLCITTDRMLTNEAIAQLPIKDTNIVDRDFLYYYLKNYNFHQLGSTSSIATAINSTYLKKMEIDLPPIDQQRAIAAVLSSIDDKIESNNAINNNLEQQAALLFDENYSNNNYNISTLEGVATIKYGKGLPTKKLTAQGFPVFGGNGVIGRYTHFMYEEPQVLVSCRGAASGKIMESYPNSFVTNNSLILEWNDYRYYEFYKQFLLANPLNSYATGSAQPQITIDNIKNVPIPYPNYDEISELCLTLKSISSLHYENVIENNKLANLRDTLLPHLMSGELDVSNIEI